MLKRNIEKYLWEWRDSPIRKPLILRGARQVGKTSVVRQFAHEAFREFIEINLEKTDHFRLFHPAVSIADFLQRIGIFFNVNVTPGKTLIFIDEIQQSTNLMTMLRFFAEEAPALHVIAAGSLLDVVMRTNWNIPVGRVEYMYVYPLTFFEYLRGKGKGRLLQQLETVTIGQPTAFHELAVELFKEYMTIGGMPEAANHFIATGDYANTHEILSRIHTAYKDDIGKYAKTLSERKYLELVIEHAPKVAGSLFIYENFGGLSYRSREMAEAVRTIEKARLLYQVKAVPSAQVPLIYREKRAKKMIWLDIGMVNEVHNIRENMISGIYKGNVMEQIVGQTLLAGGVKKPTEFGYWARNRDEGSAEVDFCLQHGNRLVGMEVKSGTTREMKSLFSMIAYGKGSVIPVRVSWDPLEIELYRFNKKTHKIMSLPIYLLERWRELLS